MFDNFLARVSELRAAGEPFAIAVVVRFEAPISGKTGDKAVIRADGTMSGWIGGGCSQPVVIKEALKALQDGKPRLIRISPDADPNSEPGIVDYTMTCHSGGTLDIYIEPVLPKPQIVILGRSVVAQTLARLGKAIDYQICVAAPGIAKENFSSADAIRADFDLGEFRVTPQTFVVVSTQGESDEEGLEAAARSEAAYVAFVASRTKAQKISEALLDKGVSAGRVAAVKAPAGLQIGAVSPEEIAVSILAEIVQVGRSRAAAQEKPGKKGAGAKTKPAEAKDPICGMLVDVPNAKYKSEYKGNTFYFCCSGCKLKFDSDPARYSAAATASRP
jgi:xanthine dehydrogenase accessory factor